MSHSLFVALLLGLVGFRIAPVYGLVMALAVLAHILEDQMGFMGTNLFFPLSRQRTTGWKLFHSGDAIPNFLTVWIGLAVILLNLDRYSTAPLIPVLPYLLIVIVLPSLCFLALWAWRQRPVVPRSVEVLAAIEALDEMAEIDI